MDADKGRRGKSLLHPPATAAPAAVFRRCCLLCVPLLSPVLGLSYHCDSLAGLGIVRTGRQSLSLERFITDTTPARAPRLVLLSCSLQRRTVVSLLTRDRLKAVEPIVLAISVLAQQYQHLIELLAPCCVNRIASNVTGISGSRLNGLREQPTRCY